MDEHEFREKVLVDLADIKACGRQTDKDINSLKKTVYGNGKVGLKTQVFILWGFFCALGGLVIRVLAK